MKNTSLIMAVLVFAGLGTAGVLTSFATISGTATVQGPTFHLDDGSLYLDDTSGPTLSDGEYVYQFDTTTTWYPFEATISAQDASIDSFNITSDIDQSTVSCSNSSCTVDSQVDLDELRFDVAFDSTPTDASISITRTEGS